MASHKEAARLGNKLASLAWGLNQKPNLKRHLAGLLTRRDSTARQDSGNAKSADTRISSSSENSLSPSLDVVRGSPVIAALFLSPLQRIPQASIDHRGKPAAFAVAVYSRNFGTKISSTNDGSWDGGEQMADEMIRYSQSQGQKGWDESIRVLEHGLSFLAGDGKSCATSSGRVLLALSTLYADRAMFEEAFRALEQAASLDGASPEVQVAAQEAHCGLSLRRGADAAAFTYATTAVQVANDAGKGGWADGVAHALRSRALSALALTEHLRGNFDTAERLFVEANSFTEEFNEDFVYGSAAASLADAEHCHAAGQLSHAAVLYERALTLARRAEGGAPHLAVAAAAMAPREVIMGALAGLGQLAAHLGDYEEAESKLTEGLTQAESISGEGHPRVGGVLAALAHVYFCRAKATRSGDRIVAEGLYRRALQLLGAPPQTAQEEPGLEDLADLIALTRARYAEVIGWAKNRSSEAERLKASAEAVWRGPRPIAEALAQSAVPAEDEGSNGSKETNADGAKRRYSVIDVRLGRILM